MHLIDGRPVYAATDLVGYLACEHLPQLERAALAGLTERPTRNDPELDIIRRRGFEHEQRFLDGLRAEGRSVVEIERDGSATDQGGELRRAARETEEAMARGPDVVFQATFFDGTWRGHADFLLRVESPDRPSCWGPYHYEVADTKLARHVKSSAVLQICSYVDQLTRIQGVRPEWMHVALGGSSHAVERLRVDDFMAYYRTAKARFLQVVADPATLAFPSPTTYPEPVDHCDVCRWSVECGRRRRDDDHLSLVAGISARQRRALAERGVTTLARLGRLELPVVPRLEGTSEQALERIREQARIQLEGREEERHKYELLRPRPGEAIDPERGLATLPVPSRNDLFFDIEGDPYAFEDGLDYLFGVLESDGTFHAFWSREEDGTFSPTGERRAFERLVDFIMERLEADSTLHVYHYAPYEPTALKRLMGRYGTREVEIDRLLRGGVLVDLLRAVRQSLRASVESYSIKRLEPLYGFEREVDLRDAGSSIVAFEEWLELGEGERPAADHLDRIERYNRDDVVSNARLRDWLEERRRELAGLTGQEVPRPASRSPEAPAQLSESDARVQEVADRLTADVPIDPSDRTEEQAARWLLAQLLSWHRRESKAAYWDFYRRIGMTPDELIHEDGALGRLELVSVSEPWRPPRARVNRRTAVYRFPPQEHRDVGSRSELYDPEVAAERAAEPYRSWQLTATVGTIDDEKGTVELVWLGDHEIRHPEALVALNIVPDKDLRASLLRLGDWVAEHGLAASGPWQAARDLLLRLPPRCGQPGGEALQQPGESGLDAARRLVRTLDDSTLAIQGPPGSGKTYTGARMVLALIDEGKRVGISATSHKVIEHFLRKVLEAADEAGRPVRAIQKVSDDITGLDDPRVEVTDDNGRVRAAMAAGEFDIAAGTAWLWAAEQATRLVDVLFVDEAGQISLANVLAMSPAASSMVLLGDPQQLEQPLQGSHPDGADQSALAHLLAEHRTMPTERGLFLESTWRLHRDLCTFTSEAFYDGRLAPEAHLAGQRVVAPPPGDGTGPRLVQVPTAGFDNESPTEAQAVADLATTIVSGGRWIDEHGTERRVGWDDVLIVAPYNAQVGAIRRLLPDEARVGTVDKFQGQEAPISLYSMTTSAPEHAPRGMAFLYSRNRLNVATSRARCIAVVVASPALLRVRARTPDQMRLANALCRFAELAAGADAETTGGRGRDVASDGDPASPGRASRPVPEPALALWPDLEASS